jgi:hypothetical protein
MKRSRRRKKPSPASARRSHARSAVRHSSLPPIERQVEIPLPPALNTERVRRSGAVALLDVEGQRLRLRLLRGSLAEEPSAMTPPEEAALARGGVAAASADDVRRTEAQAAAAYRRLRAQSLGIDEAARRLDVTTGRVRQRLAEGSLYGLKDGNTWRLPAFQFAGDGLVPNIEAVLKRLPVELSPLAVARWLTSPNPDLCTRGEDERPMSPRRWLLEGHPPEAAAELAAAL